MKSLRFKITIAVAIFLAALIILYGAIYLLCKKYLNVAEVQKFVATRGYELLHRNVAIGDKIDFVIDWNFTPVVKIYSVTISNLAGSKNPNFVQADDVRLQINLLDLLFKEITIVGITFNNPVIHLETVQGVNNWDFGLQHNDKQHSITVKSIHIINGNVSYEKNGTLAHTVVIDNFTLDANTDNTYFDYNISGTFDSKKIASAGELALNAAEYKLILDSFAYADVDLSGNLRINRTSKAILGEFKSKQLNLDTLLGVTSSNASGEYAIPNTAIPVDFLRDAKVNVIYTIGKFTFHDIVLNNIALNATSQDNKLSVAFGQPLKFAKGTLDMQLTYNLNAAPPSLDFTLTTNKIDFETFMKDLAGKSPISGGSVLDIKTALRSTGTTYAALVNNLSGTLLITASSGTYLNGSAGVQNILANVLSGVITFEKAKSNTSFTCGVMNFKVNNGVAVANRAVAIEAGNVNVLGNGRVDLRNGRIDFAIIPSNINPISAMDVTKFSMAQAVSVTGTISKPIVTFNAAGLVNTNNVMSAASLATKVIGWQIGLASLAKDAIMPAQSDQASAPCKTALAN